METCVRGFSFMADNKVDMVDLQFIEGGELERAWRSNRRERMKQREQKIWDKFVEEQDVVKGVCTDDPYQFLDQLPESCFKETMDSERQRLPRAKSVEEIKVKEVPQPSTGNYPSGDDGQHTCVVTFADDLEKDECDMFHIFDDDQSGLEEDVINEPLSPETVRDNQVEQGTHSPTPTMERHIPLEKTSSKSSENVTYMIESSIYCAKVKDLRMKINEELISLMTTLDRRDILTSEPDDIMRMVKRSAEFCGRFNRIYMYQLQRQIHDIKRNNSISLPFAKHTQFQSQMVRIVSLHQNMLQSFQVFHKSVSQTCCVRESASALGSLIACVRDSTHMCLNVPPPKDFTAALDLYKDDLILTCDKVDEFVGEYAIRCEEFLNSFVNVNPNPRKAKKQIKKRNFGNWNKSVAKNDTEARLSMYSLDTLRLNLHPKSTSSKDNQPSTVKNRVAKEAAPARGKRAHTQVEKPVETAKSLKNKSRRPLMRDPHAGRPRAPKPIRENDIRTMVEGVETCASSHISREASPLPLGVGPGLRRKAGTPRRPAHTPRTLTPLEPLTPLRVYSPLRNPSPLRSHSPIRAPSPLRPNSPFAPLTPLTPRTPQTPLTLQRRHSPRVNHAGPPYHMHDPHRPKVPPSPRNKKRSGEQKQKRPLNLISAAKEAGSGTKTDLESEDMMTPVCKIQCAMKKNLELEEAKLSAREQSIKKSPSRHRVDPNEKKKLQPLQGFPDTPRLVPGLKLHGSPPKRDGEDPAKYGECSKPNTDGPPVPHREPSSERKERNKIVSTLAPDRCEVTRLLKQLCSGDASRTERVTGAKNAQLVFVNGNNPRQPSTPQLLRILEETIQKKIPKPLFGAPSPAQGLDRYRLVFNISEKTADSVFQYRTKFVQHMLTSSMYANSAVGQPWEMIGSVSEHIIDEVLLNITKEMQIHDLIQEMYNKETC